MTKTNYPIGIFDSGLGGLTIWKACRDLLPNESFIYLADHANVPYGVKSVQTITQRVLVCLNWLLEKQCKLLVVACNTATVAGIEFYRKKITCVPIVGVVPVIKKAAEITKTNSIAVFTTPFTAKSKYQKDLIKKFTNGKKVRTIFSSTLVSLIESGEIEDTSIIKETGPLLKSLSTNTDTLVLGCTHFPFVSNTLQAQLGNKVELIDSSGAVARQVTRVLTNNNQLVQNIKRKSQFFTTGNQKYVSKVASKLMKSSISFLKIRL